MCISHNAIISKSKQSVQVIILGLKVGNRHNSHCTDMQQIYAQYKIYMFLTFPFEFTKVKYEIPRLSIMYLCNKSTQVTV